MNRYALLKDSINDSIFGVVVDSNGLSKFHGVSAKGIEWSKWANGISVKSENSGLPIGVVVGGYSTLRNTNPNYVQALVDTVSLRNPSINKKQGISDSLIKNSSSIVPNVRDAELRAFDIDKRNEAIAFKARAFRTDSKVSSLLTQVRAERLGFVSAEGVFSSRNPIHTPEVKQAEIIDSYGRSLQRAIGLSLIRKKSVKMLAVVRKDQALAQSFGIEFKAAGIGPKIGSRLSGGLRAAPAGMSFVDVTGVTDADTDGIVFEGKPGLERPIIPRFMVPKNLARKLSGIVEGDAEEIEKQRRAGNTSVQFDEGKLRNIVASVGGDASLLQAVNNDRGVPATTTSGRERVSVAARNVAGNIGSRRREIASRRGMRSRDDSLLDDYFRGEIERMSDRDRNNLFGRYEGEEFSGAESIGDFNPTESGAVSLLRRDRLEARGGNDFGDPKPLSSSELQKLSESELVDRLIEDRYAGLTLEDAAEKYGLKGGRAEARRLEAREMSRRNSGGMRSRVTPDDITNDEIDDFFNIDLDENKYEILDEIFGKPTNEDFDDIRGRDWGFEASGPRGSERDYRPSKEEIEDAWYEDSEDVLRENDYALAKEYIAKQKNKANGMRSRSGGMRLRTLTDEQVTNITNRLNALESVRESGDKEAQKELLKKIFQGEPYQIEEIGPAWFEEWSSQRPLDKEATDEEFTDFLESQYISDAYDDIIEAYHHNGGNFGEEDNFNYLLDDYISSAPLYDRAIEILEEENDEENDGEFDYPSDLEELAEILKSEDLLSHQLDRQIELRKNRLKTNKERGMRSRSGGMRSNSENPDNQIHMTSRELNAVDDRLSNIIESGRGGFSAEEENALNDFKDSIDNAGAAMDSIVMDDDVRDTLIDLFGNIAKNGDDPNGDAKNLLGLLESVRDADGNEFVTDELDRLGTMHDMNFDGSVMRAPGGVRRAIRRAMANRRGRNDRGMRSRYDDPTLEVEEKLGEFLTPSEVGNVMYNGVETLSGSKRSRAEKIINDVMRSRSGGMRSRINTIEGIGTTEPYRRQLAERSAEIIGKEPVLNGRLLRISRLVSYEPGQQGQEDMANEIANHVAETRDAIYDAVLSGDIDTEEANDYIYEMFNNLESSLKEVFGVEDRGGVWSNMTTPAQQKFEEDFASDAAKRFERAAASAESMRNLKEQGIYSDAAHGPSMFEPRQGEDLIDESNKYLDQELSDLRNWSEDNPLADAGEAWDRWAEEVRKETGYLEDASLNEHVDTFLREEETDFLNAAYANQQQHLGSRADAVMRGVGMRSSSGNINSFDDYLNHPAFDRDFAEWRKDNPGKNKRDFIDDPDGAEEYFSLGMEEAGASLNPESYFGTSGMRSRSGGMRSRVDDLSFAYPYEDDDAIYTNGDIVDEFLPEDYETSPDKETWDTLIEIAKILDDNPSEMSSSTVSKHIDDIKSGKVLSDERDRDRATILEFFENGRTAIERGVTRRDIYDDLQERVKELDEQAQRVVARLRKDQEYNDGKNIYDIDRQLGRVLDQKDEVVDRMRREFRDFYNAPPSGGMRSSTGTEQRPHLNIPVTDSSALRQASYDAEREELVITYANGKTYTYKNVSNDDLDNALSGRAILGNTPDTMTTPVLSGAAVNQIKKTHDFREGGLHTFDQKYQGSYIEEAGGEFSVDRLSRLGRGEKTQIPVSDSSAIEALTWDDQNKDLIVTYAGGRTYTYKDVDSYWIEDLERETGTGRIINNIKKEGYRVVDGGEHGDMPSEGLTTERARFGMRSRMAPSSGRIRAAEMEISARPQGMASRRSEGLKDPRFAVPGRDRVDPSDGQLWSRLSDEEKTTVANRAVNREKMLLNEFKQRFPRWWDRASKEADKKGWDKDLMKGGNAGWLDELHRFVTKLADDPDYPEKSRADAEKQFNDLQALFNMRVNRGSHDLLEHLNPTSRRYLFDDARRDDSKKTGISASGKEMKTPSTAPRPFGEPIDVGTPIREQVGQSQKKPLKERLDSYYKRMSDKILYSDPARQARREMRKARRQGINAGGFTESEANPVDDAKRRIRRRKRIKQMRKNRTRDIGSISDSSTGNRIDGRLAHTDSQGSLVFGDKLTSTLATMMANYRTESKLKKTKGSVNKNRALAVLWDGAGYNGTPHVITAEEFKTLHAAGWVPVVRGHGKGSNGVRYANDWIDDPVRFITGQGGEAQGEGEYWARPNQGGHNWFSWMDGSLPAGTVGLLPPSTRRVSLSELGKIKSEHAPLAKSIKAFDAGLPSGEREKMDAEEYVTQLRDHLRSSLGPIYESTMSTKMGQMTSKILESLSGSSDSKKQELLDSLEFLELISRQKTSNSYAPLLGYDTIMADSGVELIHNRTAITIVGDTFTRDDAVNLAKSKA